MIESDLSRAARGRADSAGQVDMAGIGTSNPFQFAVTGGTGRFQNARGQSTTKLLPGQGHPAQITLSLLP